MDADKATLDMVATLIVYWGKLPTGAWYTAPLVLARDLARESAKERPDNKKWVELMTLAHEACEGRHLTYPR